MKSFTLNNEKYLYLGNTPYWHRSSPILFPNVGKFKNNNYKYKNKTYSFPIHRFARFNEFELINKSNDNLTFKLSGNKSTLKYYPFNFKLIISYTLSTKGLKSTMKYQQMKKRCIFLLGYTPLFY